MFAGLCGDARMPTIASNAKRAGVNSLHTALKHTEAVAGEPLVYGKLHRAVGAHRTLASPGVVNGSGRARSGCM